jgi:hypothetical protein
VFGPHFSVFPDENSKKLSNKFNNAVYIQPSLQCVNVWKNDFGFNNIPIKSFAFGVDTELFSEKKKGEKVFVYYKQRHPSELKFVENFLTDRGISYKIFSYGHYNEVDYREYLSESKYGIWLGRHESQGYALQEALSSNVPLFVWSAKYMKQEYTGYKEYENIKTEVWTIPYWDERCGKFFFDSSEMYEKYLEFMRGIHPEMNSSQSDIHPVSDVAGSLRLTEGSSQNDIHPVGGSSQSDIHGFFPRQFILENLTMEKRAKALLELI